MAAAVDFPVRLTVIVPALNEAGAIAATLRGLQPLRRRGHEIIVADGGSDDRTAALAAPWADRVLAVPRGRARQMNAGAREARGDVLWFLHADTIPPANADGPLLQAVGTGQHAWGRFDVRLSGSHPLLRVVEATMNRRSRLSGIATGDQGIFVRRDVFAAAGGFPDIPLMEDIALTRCLRRRAGRPACLTERVVTSSRRWEEKGVLRTIVLMWRLRLAYYLGADPRRLARAYR